MKKREIKFRAWDKIKGEMNYKVLVGNTDSSDENYTCNSILNKNTFEWMNADHICIDLMQYIGLKDSKGIEIYEGDLCTKERHDAIYEIVFYKNGWAIKNETDVAIWHQHFCSGARSEKLTVIGNIHEIKN